MDPVGVPGSSCVSVGQGLNDELNTTSGLKESSDKSEHSKANALDGHSTTTYRLATRFSGEPPRLRPRSMGTVANLVEAQVDQLLRTRTFPKMPHRPLIVLLATFALPVMTGCKIFTGVDRVTSTDVNANGLLLERPVFEEETPKPSTLSALDPTRLGHNLKRATGHDSDPVKARQVYAEGEALFLAAERMEPGHQRRQAFRKASRKFGDASGEWPGSEVDQDSLFMSAESYFFADDYPESNELFERLAKDYPNNRHTDLLNARRFRIAQYWLSLIDKDDEGAFSFNFTDKQRPWRDTRGNALRIYDKIRLDDPRGKLADDATMAAANAYFRDGKYYEADEYYLDLRTAFPNSEHQFMAHYLAIQAKVRSYRGPEYSGAVLDEAEELVKQVWRQFPVEGDENREDLNRAWAEIRHKQAERDWLTARYYTRQKAYGAAKFQLAQIMNDYEDTAFGKEAQLALSEIADRPNIVEAPFAWLENYVPTKDKPKPLVAAQPYTDTLQR